MAAHAPKVSLGGSVIEDYVKVIYLHTEWQSDPMSSSTLAARMDLAPSSVTEMVKKLAASGLVSHVPYGAITLTDAGRRLAMRMIRRHRLIETWLVQSFGYSWDQVHEEAEVLEHALSDRLLAAIDQQLGHPRRDPHGDPIPAADGTVERPDAVLLSEVPAGRSGRIVRISDRDPTLLRYLEQERVVVDARLVVIGRKPFGGALAIEVEGAPLDLGDAAAGAIWVSR